jgi:hypothetical protein
LKFLILEDESVHPFRIYKNIANFVARTNISDIDEVKAVRCVDIDNIDNIDLHLRVTSESQSDTSGSYVKGDL